MKKNPESAPLRELQTNLLQQNCYVRDVTNKVYTHREPITQYESLDTVVEEDGVKLRRAVQDYPITPQYVQSFVDSADYRKDPLGAIANGKSRQNLGDITEMQQVSNMGTDEARAMYEQLKQRFSEAEKQAQAKSIENNSNSEVTQDVK